MILKNFVSLAFVFLFVMADIFAQSSETKTLLLEDKYSELHPSASYVKLELNWTPADGSATIVYSCKSAVFDHSQAMNTVCKALKDFQSANQYSGFHYKKKDKTKYITDEAGNKFAMYTSSVVFTR